LRLFAPMIWIKAFLMALLAGFASMK